MREMFIRFAVSIWQTLTARRDFAGVKMVWWTIRLGGKMPISPKWFKPEEVAGLDDELVAGADLARQNSGVPFILTQTVRKPDFQDGNAVKNSAHIATGVPLRGHAFDMLCETNRQLHLMQRGLYAARFTRWGIYFKKDARGNGLLLPTHIHVDNAKDKPQEVTFCSMEE